MSQTSPQLEAEAKILAEQAERFVSQFKVDLSGAEVFTGKSNAFRIAANAYERIALAEKKADPAEWFRASNVDGRTAKEIMDRLWAVREALGGAVS